VKFSGCSNRETTVDCLRWISTLEFRELVGDVLTDSEQPRPRLWTESQVWQRLCAGTRVIAAGKEQKANALSNLNFEGRDFGADKEQRL